MPGLSPKKGPYLAPTVPSQEYLEGFEERLREERATFWTRIRIVSTLVALMVVVAALLGYGTTRDVATRLNQLQRAAYTSCLSRNEALAEQKVVYQQFIETEQADDTQDHAIQRAKILTYQQAINKLPEPVDCRQFLRR